MRHRGFAALLALTGLLWAMAASAFEPEAWLESTRGGASAVPRATELVMARAQFARLFRADIDATTKLRWQNLGFDFALHALGGERFAAVSEKNPRKQGRGAYLFRLGASNSVLLQAPHQFYDLHTGTIVLQLMLRGQFSAAAWNSIDRKQNDLTRSSASYLLAMTEAFAESSDPLRLIQIHGFDTQKRRTEAARNAALIISAGHRNPGPDHQRVSTCLGREVTRKTRLFPDQVSELGGTLNSVGSTMRTLNQDHFLHLELALSLRQRLRSNEQLLGGFSACLLEPGP